MWKGSTCISRSLTTGNDGCPFCYRAHFWVWDVPLTVVFIPIAPTLPDTLCLARQSWSCNKLQFVVRVNGLTAQAGSLIPWCSWLNGCLVNGKPSTSLLTCLFSHTNKPLDKEDPFCSWEHWRCRDRGGDVCSWPRPLPLRKGVLARLVGWLSGTTNKRGDE